jgi:hypothetical protein
MQTSVGFFRWNRYSFAKALFSRPNIIHGNRRFVNMYFQQFFGDFFGKSYGLTGYDANIGKYVLTDGEF